MPPPDPIPECAEPEEVAPPEEAVQEPLPAPTVELIAVAVRDIADGEPICDLQFVVNGSEEPLSSDGTGILRIKQEDLGSVRPKGDEWNVLRTSDNRGILKQDTIWLYRHVRIEGTVQFESKVAKLDLTTVKIEIFAIGEDESAKVVAREHLDSHWFDRHSLHRLRDVCKIAEDGTFAATIPRIPGFAISAAAPGWLPEIVPVSIASDPCAVRLVLRKKSLQLTGTVKTADGDPLADVLVSGYVVIRLPADQLRREEYAASGHGYSLRVSKKENRAILMFGLGARTDDNGVFHISSNVKGELSLFVSPGGGLKTTYVAGGSLDDDRADLEIVVGRGDGGHLQIMKSGMVLKNVRVNFGDRTLVEQYLVSVTLDDSGRAPTCVLMRGHKYNVSLAREHHRYYYFTWDGQKIIDLDKLPKKPPWRFGR